MNIICGTLSKFDVFLHITDTFQRMGHMVKLFPIESYREVCSYPEKKLDKLGFHQRRNRYLRTWLENLYKTAESFHPDLILFINGPKEILQPEDLINIKKRIGVPIICWFVDGVIASKGEDALYPYYDRIYVFEQQDVSFLKERYNITAAYCPVGYNAAYAGVKPQQNKNMDVVFMGAPFKNRLRILEEVAAHAARNEWRMGIYGPFYEERYFWKKHIFRRQYPNITRYLQNGIILPEDAARFYADSKICLNIHLPEHKSVNPRTFEIMATGSFQLVDERADYADLVPGEDMAVFRTIEELIDKITYYLSHEDEREQIAAHGRNSVLDCYSMENSLEALIGNSIRRG